MNNTGSASDCGLDYLLVCVLLPLYAHIRVQGRRAEPEIRIEARVGRLTVYVYARPIRGKSGLITTLAGADGYFCIDRDCEGLPQGAEIQVTITGGV